MAKFTGNAATVVTSTKAKKLLKYVQFVCTHKATSKLETKTLSNNKTKKFPNWELFLLSK